MMADLDGFKKQLEKLKESTGVDFDTNKIVESVQSTPEKAFDKEAFIMARIQLDALVKGFEDYYAAKGRGLRVTVEITKEDSADTHGERWVFGDGIEVMSIIQIGTKGKYQPVEAINR